MSRSAFLFLAIIFVASCVVTAIGEWVFRRMSDRWQVAAVLAFMVAAPFIVSWRLRETWGRTELGGPDVAVAHGFWFVFCIVMCLASYFKGAADERNA